MVSCINIEDIEYYEFIDLDVVYDISVDYNDNFYLSNDKPILVHNSGKTYAALQAIDSWSIENSGLITTIVAEDIPNLKKGAIRDQLRIINESEEFKQCVTNYNQTDRTITFYNDSIVEFTSYEDAQDAKSGKRNILFVNEADAILWDIYWQLAIRTNLKPFSKIIIDYNPSCAFWAHQKLIGKPDVKLIISDHRKNYFLNKAQHDEIENIEDPDLWEVYARGKTGMLKANIYSNWNIITSKDFPIDFDETIWGIDYGYGAKESSGKTAIIKIGFVKPNKLYLRECCYHTGGMDEYQIKQVLEENKWINGQPFYSEHDPQAIGGLRKLGIYVLMAIKGERSEWHGIRKVKKFIVYYTAEDSNLHEERTTYQWVTVGDIITDTVKDTRKYHLMAALRMGIYTHFYHLLE